MTSADAANYYFKKAARIMDVGERIETLLITPLREVKAQVSIELDNGEIRTFTGWYTSTTGGTLYAFTTAVSGPTTVHARWAQNTVPSCWAISGMANAPTTHTPATVPKKARSRLNCSAACRSCG